MSKKGKPPEAHGEQVPIWIISFADMITLLLAFFVMMQSMAHSRDATLLRVGQDSFKRAIAGMGIPDVLFGREPGPGLDYRKLKYPTESAEPTVPPESPIDPADDRIRNAFREIQRTMAAEAGAAQTRLAGVILPKIRFARGASDLDDAARAEIAAQAIYLKEHHGIRVAVVGLAAGEESEQAALRVSAQRAFAVQRALEKAMADLNAKPDQVFSWGNGEGAKWCEAMGIKAAETSVVLLMLQNDPAK